MIAHEPVSPRDHSRLLVYDRSQRQTFFTVFNHLIKFLPPQSLIVFNDTKVIPARFTVTKPDGRQATLLYLAIEGDLLKTMTDRHLSRDSKLVFQQYSLTVIKTDRQFAWLKPSFPAADIFTILNQWGVTPLPPYLKHTPLSESDLRQSYQSVFARHLGSIAAPTASLHFTNSLLNQISAAGHETTYLTLHVNLGTFSPLQTQNFSAGTLHSEYFSIPPAATAKINQARQRRQPIIAIGTTTARALESAATPHDLTSGSASTNIFIRPGYRWQVCNHLITNFHLPHSSLMYLVASMTGVDQLLTLYQQAIDRQYRFYSFGDAMFIK